MVDLQEKKENQKISILYYFYLYFTKITVGRARRSRNQVGL